MLVILAEILICFFACYGLLILAINIVNSIRQRTLNEEPGIKLVLMVKNQEETIEGIVRNIYMGGILKKVMSDQHLTIIDMGSTDKTMEILEKLKKDYVFFEMLEEPEKEAVFSGFDSQKCTY